MPKKILIISYYWPPSGGSGVQRWVYFAKYLKQAGYEPIVLTVDPKKATYPSVDDSLLDDIAGIQTIHTDSFEPLQIYSKLVSGSKKEAVPFGSVDTKGKSLVKKIPAFIRGNLVLPDARKYWKRYALGEARKLIQQENIEIVITTGPPHSTHLIGLDLKKEFQLPWIADFRDPWSEIFYNKDLYRTKWAKKKDRKMESAVLLEADAVLAISPHTAALLYPKMVDSTKVHCILNGFEKEKFESIEITKNKHFTIAYVGYLGKHHLHTPFTEGLNAFCKQQEDTIQLHLAGTIEAPILADWKSIHNLNIIHEGVVPHQRAIEIMASADLLFLSIPISEYAKGNIPGKLLEYLATGKPIVLVGEDDSDAATLTKQFPNNLVLSKENNQKFIEFCEQVKNNALPQRKIAEGLENFTRKETTNQLIQVIERIS